MEAHELSSAIVAYLGWGTSPRPGAHESAVAACARSSSPGGLVDRVRAIVAESLAVPVDWESLSLADAGRAVAAGMGARHPELDQPALDALAWSFTYAWR
ncbi:hypothetical protein [Nocardioides mangrovi]|uniref:Iron-containing alcohol dehydrogenase n=1 Tax=Nocardioides mangrovi TaxID=2874580 RepID=A0ABS7UE05_9ACTN|nr:hypothetical protein [Nocardioides mangrovi]MBZ5739226.1 hypothetical protein [Nocardioides mangrovi]